MDEKGYPEGIEEIFMNSWTDPKPLSPITRA
jgi:hypothetical protein